MLMRGVKKALDESGQSASGNALDARNEQVPVDARSSYLIKRD